MGSNPYEAPEADVGGGASPQPGAEGPPSQLSPELEMRAMALLGHMRSRATGVSFAVSWAVCTGLLALVTGLVWAAIVGGILAGVISRAWVAGQTPQFVERVSAELGIPPGTFKPEQYLL